MKLIEIAALFNIKLIDEIQLSGISIDSRQVQPGHLFIAIRGETLDGHDYINDAIKNGAVAIVSQREIADLNIPQLIVSDTIKALGIIASLYRQSFTHPVIALTGSNGKTTVKEMIASILPKPSFATPGNFNNHIGAPLSVLKLMPEHRYAVFELGASHIGEIEYTVSVVKPIVSLINNIAPAHIEGFGSIDGVAQAKGEIYQGLPAHGVAIINEDDHYAHFWDSMLTHRQCLRFSTSKPTDIHAQDIKFKEDGCAHFLLVTPKGQIEIQLAVPGAHHVHNALAAAACTYAINIDLPTIAAGLSRFNGVSGRLTFLHGINQAVIIDDTYNANLRSVLTAINVLASQKGRRIFVFGDMGELGAWSEQHHQEVGLAARESGIDSLMTCGTQSEQATKTFGAGAKHYPSKDRLAEDLLTQLEPNTVVLVKGSRSSAMEQIVHRLLS